MLLSRQTQSASSPYQTQAGMTLVELLVVISIIMLLISILLPVVMKAREAAATYYCMTELQTLGTAHMAYSLDFQGGIVPMIRASSTYPSIEWYTALRGYGKEGIETGTYADRTKGWVQCPRYVAGYNSYAQNDRIGFKDFLGGKSYFPTRFAQIPNPGTMVLMTEHGALLHNSSIVTNLGKDYGQPHYNYFPTPHYARRSPNGRLVKGNANVLFCDGHAESINWLNNWLTYDNLRVVQ